MLIATFCLALPLLSYCVAPVISRVGTGFKRVFGICIADGRAHYHRGGRG